MVDKNKIENAIRDILIAIGENPDREGLADTPKRVAKAYEEIFQGYEQKANEHTAITFESNNNNPVILTGIKFHSMCEHHILPFFGTINIAYVPNKRVIGLSKIVRIIEVYSKRVQIQERLTEQIAESLFEELKCRGVYIEIKARHMCMDMRGVENNPDTVTSFKLGVYQKDNALLMQTIAQMGVK